MKIFYDSKKNWNRFNEITLRSFLYFLNRLNKLFKNNTKKKSTISVTVLNFSKELMHLIQDSITVNY